MLIDSTPRWLYRAAGEEASIQGLAYERFGPVRVVKPELVFELGFEANTVEDARELAGFRG